MTRGPRIVALAVALFRRLTALLPAAYRRRHRHEPVAMMARLASDAHVRRGRWGVLVVTTSATVDLLRRLPVEYDVTIDALGRELWYACRSLARSPLYSATAIATLALGIGLNAAVFSVVDWVLLRPLPYPSPQELVRVFTAGTAPVTAPAEVTPREFATFAGARAFRATAAFSTATRVIAARAGQGFDPVHAVVARVTGDLFGTLGVAPEIGPGLTRDESASGAAVVVVSHTLWLNQFSADRAIAGRVLAIDGRPHTIVGVMPPGRGYPRQADLWRPLTAEEREDDDRELTMIGRLASGTTAERASLEVATVASALSAGARRAWAEDVQRTEVRDVRATLTALFVSAALILLLTCANVAALSGARGADRAGELALRGALGASRARLVRQLLTESVLLAAAGGFAGLVVAQWTLDLLVALAPAGLPRLSEIALDRRVAAAGACATLIVGVVVGLIPAFRASRLDLQARLGTAGSARLSAPPRGRRVLVAAQIAVAVMLTIGAGLLARSLRYLATIDHGFAADRLLAVDLYLRGGVAGDTRQLFRDLVATAETTPGVRSAAVTLQLPTQVAGFRASVRVDGQPPAAARLRLVSPRYFETAGIPLTSGRTFTAGDTRDTPRVAVVNAAFARDLVAGRQPVGLQLTNDIIEGRFSVVGVVANVTPAGEQDRPAMYLTIEQVSAGGGSLLVRTDGDPQAVVPALRTRLRAIAPALALDRIGSLADAFETGRAVTRFNMWLTSSFAGLALLLATMGVYGLTAGEVVARWRELAIRRVLGATPREAVWTVIRPGARAVAAGLAAGLVMALGAGRWMAALLRGVTPADPTTLVAVPVLLVVVMVAAALLAALRVVYANPAATLRRE